MERGSGLPTTPADLRARPFSVEGRLRVDTPADHLPDQRAFIPAPRASVTFRSRYWTGWNVDGVKRQQAGRTVAVIGGILALLLVIAGFAASGLSGGLVMLGLLAFLVALVGLVRGRLPGIASRKAAGGLAAAAVAFLIVGGAVAPPTPTESASAVSQAAHASAEADARKAAAEEAEKAEEAAIAAAEESLAAQDEQANDSAVAVPEALPDAAADEAVSQTGETTALAALAAIEVKGRARAPATTGTCSAPAGWTPTATAATPATTSYSGT